MDKTIFFNSSLPRAGSTLFQNLIGQNPEFYVTPTSGLIELIFGAKNHYNNSQEVRAQDADLMDKAFVNFCRDGMQGFFKPLTDKPFVLDKSRGWGIHYQLINLFQERPKIVCMVRDIRSIYSSMEKNFRKNPTKENHVQNPNELVGTTLNKRIDIWGGGAPVGISVDRLQDIIQQGLDSNILFIRYEDLMDNPEEEIRKFYNYVELPYYDAHNFQTIEQITHENDVVHGIYGDHKLRTEFKRKPDDFNEILGYENCERIKRHYQWFYDYFGYV
jgi:sulfotransferase